ncbi:glycosyltransferase [Haloarcula sebkhae]|uniref:Glycosyltransferase n=2 Tax=Haloarcula sebkhae TaxID=932660 RepID=A0ACC6VNN5_9EURY|nr:glycosyltransferase [Haloarcula sebkhae]GGK72696.1 glycosyl transferase [Haloarcula sebkhae]
MTSSKPPGEQASTTEGERATVLSGDDTGAIEPTSESTPVTAAELGSHLAFFIPDLSLGGAEQVTVTIINGLAERGYDVELLLSRATGELQSELSPQVDVVEFGPDTVTGLGVASHVPALVEYLDREQPAALFPHLAHVSVVCLAARRFVDAEVPIFPTHHKAFRVQPDPSSKARVVRRLAERLYPSAEQVVAVSGGVAESLAEHTPIDPDDVSVLYNPVDVETIRARAREPVDHPWIEDEDVPVVLFVGRHERQKDLETWLAAFEQVHVRNPQVRGVVAGKGSQTDKIRELAEQHGIEDALSLPGYVENPYRYMRQADVYLLSSRYEGLPTVMIEAFACGCPIVATDCPAGPREILADGEYGPLVPVGDANALARAVEETLENPVDSSVIEHRAGEFAPASIIDDYEQFLQEHVVSV